MHEVLHRSQTCSSSKIRHDQFQDGLRSTSLDGKASLHGRIVLLSCLLGPLEIWEVILRTRASAHSESLDVRIKKSCGFFWRIRDI